MKAFIVYYAIGFGMHGPACFGPMSFEQAQLELATPTSGARIINRDGTYAVGRIVVAGGGEFEICNGIVEYFKAQRACERAGGGSSCFQNR